MTRYCKLPFIHASVRMTGHLALCCNARHAADEAEVNVANSRELAEQWNGEYFRKVRQDLIEGRPVRACAGCYEDEALGKESLRQQANGAYAHFDDGKIGFLEIGFSNTCNLACRMCSPRQSSKWERIAEAFPGRFVKLPPGFSKRRASALFEDPRNYADLKLVKLLGGEPFLDPEYKNFLVLLKQKRGLGGVRFQYYTNCTLFPDDETVELWRESAGVHVFLSLDGIDEGAGYVRAGKDWAHVERVVRRWIELSRANARIRLGVHTAVQVLNVHQYPDLLVRLLDLGIPENEFNHQLAFDPPEVDAVNLPEDYKREVLEAYAGHPLRRRFPELAARALDVIAAKLRQPASEPLERLRHYYGTLDRVHGTQLADVVPRLAECLGLTRFAAEPAAVAAPSPAPLP